MAGRVSKPFNLFKNASAEGHSVKNYAAKLLATAERMMDAAGVKLVKRAVKHNDILYVVYINKSCTNPIYRVHVAAAPEGQIVPRFSEYEPLTGLFMESGLAQVLGSGMAFDIDMHYTAELLVDLNALTGGSETVSWLDWLIAKPLASISRVYVAGMPSIAIHTDAIRAERIVGNYGAHSGKALLLWQALAGVRNDFPPGSYEGAVVP